MALSTSDVQWIICEADSIHCWDYAATQSGARFKAEQAAKAQGKAFTVEKYEDFEARQARHYFDEFQLSEITEDFYDQMLNVLPPQYAPAGYPGFFMIEATSGTITNQFCKIDGKYYGAAVDLANRETWITREKVEAIPADRPRLEWFKRAEGVEA